MARRRSVMGPARMPWDRHLLRAHPTLSHSEFLIPEDAMATGVPSCCKAHALRYAQDVRVAGNAARILREKLEFLGDRFFSARNDVAQIAAQLEDSANGATQSALQAKQNHCASL